MVSSLVFGSHNCLQVITKDTLEGGTRDILVGTRQNFVRQGSLLSKSKI